MDDLILLPEPRKLERMDDCFVPGLNAMIVIGTDAPSEVFGYAKQLADDIYRYAGIRIMITRSDPCRGDGRGQARDGDILLYTREDGETSHEEDRSQGYTLTIDKCGVRIEGEDKEGLRNGVQTLRQIIRGSGSVWPCLDIEDWPDFKNRGFYHDVARGRIPTLDSLKKLADTLVYYKMNQLQLYVESSYLFRDIPELWRGSTPLTAQEIMELDDYCYERGVELVPSLSSFGHLYDLLSTGTYGHLCELEDSVGKPFSMRARMEHHTVNVSDPDALSLIEDMISEYMQLFRTKKFNVCADETFDLGKGKSASLAAEKGEGSLYVEYLGKLLKFLLDRGHTPLFWGDIISRHPEVSDQLPEGVICLSWGYSPNQREDGVKIIHDAGMTQYVCPGVSGWNMWVNRLPDSYENIRKMAQYGRKYGAVGMLNTDWGDFGHINQPVFSVPGLIYGAVFSWRESAPAYEELNRQISVLEFGDRSGELVGILGRISDETVFSWWNAVTLKEWMGEGRENDAWNLFEEEDMSRVSACNEALDGIENELCALTVKMQDSSRGIIGCTRVAVEAIRCINLTGAYVDSLVSITKDRDGVCSVTYLSKSPDPGLADRLERCLYQFEKLWRESCTENELRHVSEVFWWYADIMRRGSIK